MNVEMNNVKNPIIIDQNYCDRKKPCSEKSSAVQVSDVLYRNITGTSASKVAIKFDCSKSFQCERIVLQDVHIQRYDGDKKPEASCENVELRDIGVVTPLCPNVADDDKPKTDNTPSPPAPAPPQQPPKTNHNHHHHRPHL